VLTTENTKLTTQNLNSQPLATWTRERRANFAPKTTKTEKTRNKLTKINSKTWRISNEILQEFSTNSNLTSVFLRS
jgi:hypothetical protein